MLQWQLLAVGSPWVFRAAAGLQLFLLLLIILLLLSFVPLVWLALRRRLGSHVAGPLWPLLLVELLVAGYAFTTTPWELPDEPRHMEHVELIRLGRPTTVAEPGAPLLSPPAPGDQQVARTIVSSLLAVEHFERRHVRLSLEPPVIIPGPSELTHPPLYYQLAALVAWPLGGAPILARLAAVRALGALLAGCLAWVLAALGRLLWPERPLMAVSPVLLVAGIPSFTLFAGAANNDALANLISALLIVVLLLGVSGRSWFARLWPWLALLALLLVAGLFTKRTTLALWPLVPVAVLLRGRRRWKAAAAAAALLLLCALAALLLLPRQRLAFWSAPVSSAPYRCAGGRLGDWALCMPARSPHRLAQHLPLSRVRLLKDTPLSLGFWARSTAEPAQLIASVDDGARPLALRTIRVGRSWQFVRLAVPPPASPRVLRVQFVPAETAQGSILLDGVILTPWSFSQTPPQLEEPGASSGSWNGRPVHNELLNGSGEDAVLLPPQVLPRSATAGIKTVADAAEGLLKQPGRVRDSWRVGLERARDAFAMFWATVGWSIPPTYFSTPVLAGLALLSALAAVGLLLLLRKVEPDQRRSLLLLALAWTLVVAAVMLRDFPPRTSMVISGRYLFPGLGASAVLLVAGWRCLWPAGDRSFVAVLLGFVVLMQSLYLYLLWWPYYIQGIG